MAEQGARGWIATDENHWVRGRYHIARVQVFDLNPAGGDWVYTSFFKSSADMPAQLIDTPQRRMSFEAAEADCAAHYRNLQPATSQPQQGVLL